MSPDSPERTLYKQRILTLSVRIMTPRLITLAFLALSLAACGGGGGDNAGTDNANSSSGSLSSSSSAASSSSASSSASSTSSSGFVHPGILLSQAQIDLVKAEITAGASLRTAELDWARSRSVGKLDYVMSTPVAVMRCGNSGSTADPRTLEDVGCEGSRRDALAAYTLSLIWAYTGDARYAARAIAILNAWSETLESIDFNRATAGKDSDRDNGPLQAAWLAELFPRSAEILRHAHGGSSGWRAEDAQRFGRMLDQVLLPHIRDGWRGGNTNWVMSMASGVMNIGVFNDDRDTFNQGLALWRARLPASIYLLGDGALPQALPEHKTSAAVIQHWYQQSDFRRSGITQETCRDSGHAQMGLASTVQAAETARIQGVDLYAEGEQRIVAAHEFLADFINRYTVAGSTSQTPVSITETWLCGGTLKLGYWATWEVFNNHYASRQGQGLPQTSALLQTLRASKLRYNDLQGSWEMLTHARLP